MIKQETIKVQKMNGFETVTLWVYGDSLNHTFLKMTLSTANGASLIQYCM